MLLYEEREFTLQELIVYLNSLETKSTVLDLKYGDHDIEVVYGIDSDNVQTLVVREDGDADAGSDFLACYCSYSNIDEEVFTAKICDWKEISYLELLSIVLNDTEIGLSFQVVDCEELYIIKTKECFIECLDGFEGMYDDDEIRFFKENG